jgi:hypothetical protein
MNGNEALRILNQVTEIHNFLIKGNDRSAFFQMGILTEELAMIVRIDECSLNPNARIYSEKRYGTSTASRSTE